MPIAPALPVAPGASVAVTSPTNPEQAPRSVIPLSATFGSADPLTLVAAAPDRRWVAICQARTDTNGDGKTTVTVGAQGALGGDRLDGYFIDAPGVGTKIDAFGGSDPTGRYVALVRDGKLRLVDTTTHVDTDLSAQGADVRDDESPFVHPRAVAFDPTGKRMLYLRLRGEASLVVVRELATGAETALDPGPGLLWRAEFDVTGAWVILRVVTGDANDGRRLEWPFAEAKGQNLRCGGPLPRYRLPAHPRGEPLTRIVRTDGAGGAIDAPGLVLPLDGAWLVRDPDETLTVVKPGGVRVTVAKKTCESRLVHGDPVRHLLVITCASKKKYRTDVDLVAEGKVLPLGVELTVGGGDSTFAELPRLVPMHPGTDAVLLDLDRRELEHLQAGDHVIATSGRRALVLRGASLVVHELGGKEQRFDRELAHFSHYLRAGSTFFVAPYVVDLNRDVLLGQSELPALALAVDGALLVAEGRTADATHLAGGPLKWKMPDAVPVPSAKSPVAAAP